MSNTNTKMRGTTIAIMLGFSLLITGWIVSGIADAMPSLPWQITAMPIALYAIAAAFISIALMVVFKIIQIGS